MIILPRLGCGNRIILNVIPTQAEYGGRKAVVTELIWRRISSQANSYGNVTEIFGPRKQAECFSTN